jgi:hypothetical protein
MTCGMIAEISTQPLDPSVQVVITTVTKAVKNSTMDVNATPDTMGATSSSRRPSSYNANQFSRQAKRLKSLALGNAVIGNRKEKSGAPDDITPAKKGTTANHVTWIFLPFVGCSSLMNVILPRSQLPYCENA